MLSGLSMYSHIVTKKKSSFTLLFQSSCIACIFNSYGAVICVDIFDDIHFKLTCHCKQLIFCSADSVQRLHRWRV